MVGNQLQVAHRGRTCTDRFRGVNRERVTFLHVELRILTRLERHNLSVFQLRPFEELKFKVWSSMNMTDMSGPENVPFKMLQVKNIVNSSTVITNFS